MLSCELRVVWREIRATAEVVAVRDLKDAAGLAGEFQDVVLIATDDEAMATEQISQPASFR
jgi:hypothetical protein